MESELPWLAILVTIILVFINGLLASSEIAFVGVNEAKLRQSAEKGDKKALRLLEMRRSPSGFLSTIQIGITLASLLSGALGADSLAKPIVAWAAAMGVPSGILPAVNVAAFALVTLLITYAMLVFGELVPKRLAMAKPEATASRIVLHIHRLSVVAAPLVRLLSASTNTVLKLLGADPDYKDAPVTQEEILLMLREGQQQGAIDEHEVRFVSNMFQFADLKVRDAMTHRTEIEYLAADATLADLAEMAAKTVHSAFPVVGDEQGLDDILGIVYDRDAVAASLVEDHRPTVAELMRPPMFVYESKSLVGLFNEMKNSGCKMAVVIDEYGGTLGIVTFTDIVEEIVGGIAPGIGSDVQVTESGYIVDGMAEMDELADFLGLGRQDVRHATLSGFIIDRLGYIPREGEHPEISFCGYRFRVKSVNGGAISGVEIDRTDAAPQDAVN